MCSDGISIYDYRDVVRCVVDDASDVLCSSKRWQKFVFHIVWIIRFQKAITDGENEMFVLLVVAMFPFD